MKYKFEESRPQNIISLLFIILIAYFLSTQDTKAETMQKCILELQLARTENPWRAYTQTAEEERSSMDIGAETFQPHMETFSFLDDYADKTGPWLMHDRQKKRVLVNEHVFTPLKRVDATRLQASHEYVIGNWKKEIQNLRMIVLFLLQAQIVATYAHIESHVCLAKEADEEDTYHARITGEHVYYTNERHVASFDFHIKLNKKTRTISVHGN